MDLRRVVSLGAVLVIGVTVPSRAGASLFELYGFGPSAVARGGAAEADTSGYAAVFYNPGNIIKNKSAQFGVGLDYVAVGYRIERGGEGASLPTATPGYNAGVHVGASTTFGGPLRHKIGLGLVGYVPIGHLTRIAALDHRQPQAYLYNALADRLGVYGAVSAEVLPWLRLGLGAQVLVDVNTDGDIALTMVDRRILKKDFELELHGRFAPIAGIAVDLGHSTHVGLVYRAPIAIGYRIPVRVFIEEVGLLDFVIHGQGLYTPHTIGLGASHGLAAGALVVSAGVTAQLWSHAPTPAPSSELRLDDRQLRLDDARGRAGGPVGTNLLDVRSPRVSLGARDILIPRAGVAWTPRQGLTLRAGANYRPTPLPEATGSASYVDAPAITTAIGVGVALEPPPAEGGGPLTLDASLGWTALVTRTAYKSNTSDPIGFTRFGGHALHLSVALHHAY